MASRHAAAVLLRDAAAGDYSALGSYDAGGDGAVVYRSEPSARGLQAADDVNQTISASDATTMEESIRVAAAAEQETSAGDEHVALLVTLHEKHITEYRASRQWPVTQLFPFGVWKKVYADFAAQFPDKRFDQSLLKTRLLQQLTSTETQPPLPAAGLHANSPEATATAAAVEMTRAGSPFHAAGIKSPATDRELDLVQMAAEAAQLPASVEEEEIEAPLSISDGVACRDHGTVASEAAPETTARAGDSPVASDGAAYAMQLTTTAAENNGDSDGGSSSLDATDIPDLLSETAAGSQSRSRSADSEISPPLPQEQQRRSPRHCLESDCVELRGLKKQKLALQNLKLARELGVYTQEECTEKARCVVQMCQL